VSDRRAHERRLGLALAAPAVAAMLVTVAYPIADAVWLSLFSYRITDPGARRFVGLENYRVVVSDPLWWGDVGTTALLTLTTVTAELVIGFCFALVLHRIVVGRRIAFTALLVPYGIVTVVSAFAWRYAFELDSGFVDSWLGLGSFSWFGARWSSLFVIGVSEVWKTTPFMALLLLAGLAQVPEELQEAAKIDGANAWQRLFKVTLPNMKGALLVALLFRMLDAYRIFDNVFVMTAGAQGTETVSFLAYRQMIGRTELGLGSSVSVLLFATVVLMAVIFVGSTRLDLSSARGER
jgi:multiple sugar transport system permease protein